MKNYLYSTVLLLFCGIPFSFSQTTNHLVEGLNPLRDVETYRLPIQDNDALLQMEEMRRGPGIAPRFAENLSVHITPSTHGTWEYLPNDMAVWRLRIYSEDAHSLNLGFTQYQMPPNGKLFLYRPDKSEIRGPFTPADNEEHEQLWTPIVYGDELVIELQIPTTEKEKLDLVLSYVNHDFVGFGKMVDAFRSGSCNLDVICGAPDGFPEVDNYRDIIRSVAVISTGGGTFCSGFLVNNQRQDQTPYFMTAFHCNINSGNAPSLVTYWNYENSFCRQPGSAASGQAGDGTLSQFNTGSTYRAGYSPTDFVLVELDDPVLEAANGFLAGWTNDLNAIPTSSIAVHHPSTDEKRISFENDPSYIGEWGAGASNIPSGDHVIVADWDTGTTEGGSSGSPLFDQNKRVVGQLHGGAAACGNNSYDSYGWFAVSWTGGGTSDTRLSDWLDPDNSGVTFIDGIDANLPTHCNNGVQDADETDVDCGGAECLACPTCSDGIQNQGELGIDCEGPCPAICPTCSDGIQNQDEEDIDCGGPCPACPCTNNSVMLTLTLDNYPEETTWQITDNQGSIIFSSDGDYGNFSDGETVTEELCLAHGCFNFTLFDSFGDGICCGHGTGLYSLSYNGTTFLSSTGEFDNSETSTFCLSTADCVDVYEMDGEILEGTYSAADHILASGYIEDAVVVGFQAGNYIEMDTSFEVQQGVTFTAQITACTAVTGEEFLLSVPTQYTPVQTSASKNVRLQQVPFDKMQVAFKLPTASNVSAYIENTQTQQVFWIAQKLPYKSGKHLLHFDTKTLSPQAYRLVLVMDDKQEHLTFEVH